MLKRSLIVLAGLGLLLTTLVRVDQSEYVLLTQLGRPVRVWDGAVDAGLHLKWPWPLQSTLRFDRRIQVLDIPPAELLTHDPQGSAIDRTLTVEAFALWRIAGPEQVEQFHRAIGSIVEARGVLGEQISSRLGAALGVLPLEALISVATPDAVDRRAETLRAALLHSREGGDLRARARQAYGLELLDVRIRRFNYPPSVRPAIAERIASERRRKAAEYEGEGVRRAAALVSAAAREAAILEAEARANARTLEEQAALEAERLRAEAHALDPELFVFLQKLHTYQRLVQESRDLILLSSRHELFDLLLKPPSPQPPASKPPKP